jgi:SPP1 family predicted phage head-tail adaptor
MSIGQLRHRITIQQLNAAQDALGQPVKTWSNVATSISADVSYLTGLQAIKADAMTSVTKATVRLRYRPLNADMRVLHNNVILDVRSVLPDARKVYVNLVCEVVNV